MPLIEVRTNLKKSQIPSGFLKRLSAKGSELTLKPESFVMAQVNPDQLLSFAGTEEPCATVTLRCIGNIKQPKQSEIIARDLTSFIAKELNIKPERFYIFYNDLAEDDVAYTGIIFAELKKKLGL